MSKSHSELIKTIDLLSERLEQTGIESEDIKKSLIAQGKEYVHEYNSRVFKGYYSECFIDLYVNQIENIIKVYAELANHQDLEIRTTEFKRNDEFEIRRAEHEKALKAAKIKAEYMAEALNTGIGKVYSIREISTENQTLRMSYLNSSSVQSSEGQNEYGNIRIAAVVEVEFELE